MRGNLMMSARKNLGCLSCVLDEVKLKLKDFSLRVSCSEETKKVHAWTHSLYWHDTLLLQICQCVTSNEIQKNSQILLFLNSFLNIWRSSAITHAICVYLRLKTNKKSEQTGIKCNKLDTKHKSSAITHKQNRCKVK